MDGYRLIKVVPFIPFRINGDAPLFLCLCYDLWCSISNSRSIFPSTNSPKVAKGEKVKEVALVAFDLGSTIVAVTYLEPI